MLRVLGTVSFTYYRQNVCGLRFKDCPLRSADLNKVSILIMFQGVCLQVHGYSVNKSKEHKNIHCTCLPENTAVARYAGKEQLFVRDTRESAT